MSNYLELKNYFEKQKIILPILSAWSGHFDFSQWLVFELEPNIMVELGVDYGFSSLSLALPGIGHVYGIDCFDGSATAFGRTDTLDFVRSKISELGLSNITLVQSYFDPAALIWSRPIDILHIDGTHTYNAVKNDFDTWSKFVTERGVILLHDTVSNDGVKQFFSEISLPKLNFLHSAGLGVVSRDASLIDKIKQNFGQIE